MQQKEVLFQIIPVSRGSPKSSQQRGREELADLSIIINSKQQLWTLISTLHNCTKYHRSLK